MALKSKRPAGVTVIAILVIIGGIFLFFGGILAAVVAMLLPAWPAGVNLELRDELTRDLYANAPQLLQVALAAMSGAFFAMGLVSMLTAWGLLNAKKWSWTIALILALISVVRTIATFVFSPTANTVTQEVFGLVLSLVIIYYLYRPPVMEYFKRGGDESPSPPDSGPLPPDGSQDPPS